MKLCSRCGAPKKSMLHQTHHSNAEVRIAAHKFVDVHPTRDSIITILKQELNYYERADRDHYFYLAEAEDIERAAERIVREISKASGPSRVAKEGE